MPVRSRLAAAPLPAFLLALMLVTGCRSHREAGPIEVSVIGPPLGTIRPAPDHTPLDAPAAALIGATGQGLVRFDAGGQIVAGAADRWIVSDEGRSLIFRLPDLPRPGTQAIDATDIARRIHAAIAPESDNPLKPLLGAIDEVNAVTPQVIDIELKAPRPNLLQLFAQPTLAIGGGRQGPFAITERNGGTVTLRALTDPDADPDSDAAARPASIRLRGEKPGTAVARFANGQSELMLGGRFTDLPIARIARLPRGALHFDPVSGLFGLAFTSTARGFTAGADVRRALAMAIDRDRIGHAFDVPGWTPTTDIVAPGTPEIPHPAAPSWANMELPARRAMASHIIASAHPGTPLRVAMPDGPGARLLFALIAADWRAVGVDAVRVGPDAPADLRLIDEVAPADVASFYLRAFACARHVPCTDVSDRILVAAREAPSLQERSVLLMQADALITDTAPFIPLGAPIRWSLVAPGLDLYRDSPRAIHPLNELRSPPKR